MSSNALIFGWVVTLSYSNGFLTGGLVWVSITTVWMVTVIRNIACVMLKKLAEELKIEQKKYVESDEKSDSCLIGLVSI